MMTMNSPVPTDALVNKPSKRAAKQRNDGKAFENRFATLMRTRYRFRRTETRKQIKGKVGARPHECDIHGELYSPIWDILSYVGIAVGLLALACVAQTWFPEQAARLATANVWLTRLASVIESRATLVHPSVAPYAVVLLGLGCTLLAHHAKGQVKRHVWVECKDRKTTIKRNDIAVLNTAVTNVRDDESNAPWKPDEVWLASTSEFDQDAVAFARELRIRCLHVSSDGSIKEVADGR